MKWDSCSLFVLLCPSFPFFFIIKTKSFGTGHAVCLINKRNTLHCTPPQGSESFTTNRQCITLKKYCLLVFFRLFSWCCFFLRLQTVSVLWTYGKGASLTLFSFLLLGPVPIFELKLQRNNKILLERRAECAGWHSWIHNSVLTADVSKSTCARPHTTSVKRQAYAEARCLGYW